MDELKAPAPGGGFLFTGQCFQQKDDGSGAGLPHLNIDHWILNLFLLKKGSRNKSQDSGLKWAAPLVS